MDIITILLVIMMVMAVYLGFIRNTQVFNFRKTIIDRISESTQAEIHAMAASPDVTASGIQAAGDQLLARYRIMDNPSYGEMVLNFWKPLNVETWYPEHSFLKGN